MPFLLYSLYRVVVLLAAFGLLLLLGAHPVVAGVLAILIASAVAYLFLRRQRDAATAWLAARAQARKERRAPGRFARAVAQDEAAEDAADDAS
ncbi:DUF4229 domain-containing protein [Xylanimonas ulmi]|uniref:DUF4229 domain-containing protein n=1 Tax=Xylanimonas ulmi TaxID=228973 RepID=UPI0013EE66A8|nr:DUF4229 domain-containing protein [Xylanibacterium ulmi]